MSGILEGHAEWSADGRTFCLTSPEAKKKASRSRFSPSTANAFRADKCFARWAAEQLIEEKLDHFQASNLGTAAHAVLEDLFNNYPVGERNIGNADVVLDTKVLPETVGAEDDDTQARWREAVRELYVLYFDMVDANSIDVVSSEWSLDSVEVAGVPFRGYIDQVSRDENGDLVVSDFKTGKWKDESSIERFGDDYGNQIRLYVLALRNETGEKVSRGELLFTKPGRIRDIDISEEHLATAEKGFVEAWGRFSQMTSSGEFPTSTGPLCGYCPLLNRCPRGQKRWVAKKELPTKKELGLVPRAGEGDHVDPHLGDGVDSSLKKGKLSDVKASDITERTVMAIKDTPAYKEFRDDGELNPDSYAATAVFGLTSKAAEILHGAGVGITPSTLPLVSNLMAGMVLEVQQSEFDESLWQHNGNTRVRGALFTAIDLHPMPFGSDADAWTQWRKTVMRMMVGIVRTALRIHTDGVGDDDMEALAGLLGKPAEESKPAAAKPAAKKTTRRKPAAKKPAAKKPVPVVEPEPDIDDAEFATNVDDLSF